LDWKYWVLQDCNYWKGVVGRTGEIGDRQQAEFGLVMWAGISAIQVAIAWLERYNDLLCRRQNCLRNVAIQPIGYPD